MRGWLIVLAIFAATAASGDVVQDAGGNSCTAWEYPIQVWRAEGRRYNEVFGLNRFARREQCEAARLEEQAATDALVTYILRLAPKARIQKWNVLECRCDRTRDTSSPYHLDEDRREVFVKIYEAARYDIWEEALDKKLSEQSELARRFNAVHHDALPSGAWPLVAEVPEESDEKLLNPDTTTLRPTTVQVTSNANGPVLDHLKLVEVDFSDLDQPYTVESVTQAGSSANAFIEREIAKVQTLLPQSFDIEDENLRDRVIEVFQQRLQLLSNLDRVISTSPPSSPLVQRSSAADASSSDSDLIRDIFGAAVSQHWSPDSLEDFVFSIPTKVSDDPVAVLRSTEEVDPETRRLATYVYLMRTPVLTENEEIWISGIINGSLTLRSGP